MRRLSLALLAALGGACGLISSDVTDFQLDLPEKQFTVDTADWELSVMGDTFPAVSCAADCAALASMTCVDTCSADCDGTNCQVHVPISIRQMFNLAIESPELQTIDEQAAISVTVDAIAFRIDEDTMNVATPPLAVYMAPIDVITIEDMRAQQVGTILPIAPGTPMGTTGQVDLTTAGREVLAAYMEDFRTPFNVIVAATVDIRAGDPVPMGRLSGVVTVDAHAGL